LLPFLRTAPLIVCLLAAQTSSCCIARDDLVGHCIETMRHVIQFGANPNFSDSQGGTLAEFCRANLTKETTGLVLQLFAQPDVIRSQLIECVLANDSGSLTAVIQQNSITEAVDEHGLNLVFLSASLGHLSCFQVLFRLASSPEILRSFGGQSLLHVAASKGKVTIVSFLAESGVFLCRISPLACVLM
jgi:ankyrin repeat protein